MCVYIYIFWNFVLYYVTSLNIPWPPVLPFGPGSPGGPSIPSKPFGPEIYNKINSFIASWVFLFIYIKFKIIEFIIRLYYFV